MNEKSPFSRTTSGDLLADRRYAYGVDAMADGDMIAARDLFTQALEYAPDWPPLHLELGKACLALGETVEAQAAFSRCLLLDPEDHLGAGVYRGQMASNADLRTAAGSVRAISNAYIAGLFDDYAPRFDHHLTQTLQYRAPQLVRGALEDVCHHQRRQMQFHTVLDLGCGTGLMARAIAPCCERIHGVDLSPGMIKHADETNLYAHLCVGDITQFMMAEDGQTLDLILAADVFCYIPDLVPVFQAAHRRMKPEALFAFTIQIGHDDAVVIGSDARVHHSHAYIQGIAHIVGFRVVFQCDGASRLDRGQPVPGAVYVLALIETFDAHR